MNIFNIKQYNLEKMEHVSVAILAAEQEETRWIVMDLNLRLSELK